MIYLDNAATTFIKPPLVTAAITDAMRRFGNPGRGGHALSMAAAEEVYLCRKSAGDMFGVSPERVIFTSGATHSLNIAVNAARTLGGAILISSMEHNAVLRPASAMCCDVRIFDACPYLSGEERTTAIMSSVIANSDGVTALVCTAASNICGLTMPLRDIGKYCRNNGILFIVDGAQAGGIYDIDMEQDFIDVLCLPSHKGLYGPMGAGLMILSANASLPPFTYGGSGVASQNIEMPSEPPERYEAGTLPVPVIAGLRRGIEFVSNKTTKIIREHEQKLARELTKRLSMLGAYVFVPHHTGGCVLFNIIGRDAEEIAILLDKNGICVRSGLHCAPLAHRSLGSEGAVRVSFSAFNTMSDVHSLSSVLSRVV